MKVTNETIKLYMDQNNVSFTEAHDALVEKEKTTKHRQVLTSEVSAQNTQKAFDIMNYLAMRNNYLVKNYDSSNEATPATDGTAAYLPTDKSIDNKDPKSVLSMFIFGDLDNLDESQLDIKKTSDGKITDIYYNGVRYGVRYDKDGNITKTLTQHFDEQGRITHQQVNDFEDGQLKQQTEYEYEYDTQGNRIQTRREAYNPQFGRYPTLLEKYFGKQASGCGMHHELEPISNIKKTQDGKITEFTDRNGVRYCLRYDENGNLTKSFTQEFDEEGTVREQNIREYNKDGSVTFHNYKYNANGKQIAHKTEQWLQVENVPTSLRRY